MTSKATDDEIIEFIDWYIGMHGYSPTVRDVMQAFGYTSPGSVQIRLKRMRRDGLIGFNDHCARTLKVTR